jgi:hypothetical protein
MPYLYTTAYIGWAGVNPRCFGLRISAGGFVLKTENTRFRLFLKF